MIVDMPRALKIRMANVLPDLFTYDENGELVSDELLNPLLPSGGAAMDTYYDHNG